MLAAVGCQAAQNFLLESVPDHQVADREGPTFVDDRKNVRAHPAIAIERDARVGFARLVRELDLDTEPPTPSRTSPHFGSRPPWVVVLLCAVAAALKAAP